MAEGTGVELLREFLSTRDAPRGNQDLIASPDALSKWLRERGLIGEHETVTTADVSQARRVRAAIRSFTAAYHGAAVDGRTAPTLSTVTNYAPLSVTVTASGGVVLEPRVAGVPGALARLVAALYTMTRDGSIDRFKVCRMCGFPFHDRTRNHSRVWCSMVRCGGVNKYRAFQERRRARLDSPRRSPAPGADEVESVTQ
jgi:predicted RNA-binding Zn ribbon-like protein